MHLLPASAIDRSKNYFFTGMLAMVFLVGLLLGAGTAYSQQNILENPVTLQLNNVSLAEALTAIGEKAGVSISYSSTQLSADKKVSVDFQDVPLKAALRKVLGTSANVHVQGTTVTIQAPSNAGGKGNVRGSLRTSDGRPAEFVNVSIKGTGKGMPSDAQGNFLIKGVPSGQQTLVVQLLGYEPTERIIQVTAGETLEVEPIAMNEDSKILQEIVISGDVNKFSKRESDYVAKLPISNMENPQVYSALSKTLFTEQLITDFGNIVKNAPGVYKIQGNRGINSDGASFYTLRGFRTEVSLVDGVPVQTNGEFDPVNVEKVEVLKGPSATLFGSSVTSFGGLLNIVTKKPVENAGGEIGYTAGSFGLNRFTADIYGPVNEKKNLLVRVNAAYQTQNSFQDAGFRKSFVISPSLEYRVNERLRINLNAGIYNGEMTSPSVVFLNRTREFVAHTPDELGFDWNRSYTSNDLTMKTPTTNVHGQVTYKLAPGWTSQTNFSSNTRKSDGFYQYEFIRGAVADTLLERNITLQNTTNTAVDIQQNFIGDFKLGSLRNRLVVGLDFLSRTVNNSNSPYIVFDNISGISADPNYIEISRSAVMAKLAASPDAPTKNNNTSNVYSVYASDVINVTDRLLAMLSLRIDRFENQGTRNQATNTYVANTEFDQTAVSPKLGIVYQIIPDQLSVFGNYMNGFFNVVPVTQPVSGISGIFKPQQANQLEGGVKMEMIQSKLNLVVSYYDIRVDNVTRSEVLVRGDRNYNITVQDATQYSRGLEVELIANPVTGLNLVAGYSHNDSEFTKSTAALEGRRPAAAGPANLANAWISYAVPNGKLKGIGAGIGGNYVSEHLTANSAITGVFTIPSYTVLNATVFYNTEDWRLGFKLDNLTNERYFVGQGVLSPQMPRNFSANLALRF
jgi:iron complex outermembrane receptor protein